MAKPIIVPDERGLNGYARASQTWRRLVISEFELKQIEELKTELQTELRQRTTPVSSTASHLHFSSNNKT